MIRLLLAFTLATGCGLGASTEIVLENHDPCGTGATTAACLKILPAINKISDDIDRATGVISGTGEAKDLLSLALAQEFSTTGKRLPPVNSAGFNCIIHTVVWSKQPQNQPTGSGSSKPAHKVVSQHWYLYNGSASWGLSDFTANRRIFGAKNLLLLYVYIDMAPDVLFTPRYEIQVTSKEPANLQHLFALAGAFVPGTPKVGIVAPTPRDYLGIADFSVPWATSDIAITPLLVQADPDTPADPTKKIRTPVGDSIVFDDEGFSYWDVSVGVPIRKTGQLQFNSVNNTVTAQNPDKRNVLALLDLYPFKKDIKSAGFDWRPYGVAGIAIGSQPLHKILLGGGWGPKYAQIYAGALFVKQQQLSGLQVGSTASPTQLAAGTTMAFKPQFAFGINLPVKEIFGAAVSATSKKAPASSGNAANGP